MPICRIHEKYPRIRCRHRALHSDPDGFCILHSRDKDKDQSVFETALKKKLAHEDYDFHGVFFPGLVSFLGHEFKKEADFSSAIFSCKAVFSGAIFYGWADFSGANFCGTAAFSGTTFSGGVAFSRAIFSGRADFSLSTFSKGVGVDFTDAYFYQYTVSHGKRTDFSDAIFIGIATFSDAMFLDRVDFSRVIFSDEAIFTLTGFFGKTSFYMATFEHTANFSMASFSEKAFFIDTTFSADVEFSGATFFWTMFIGTTFKGEATFCSSNVTRLLALQFINSERLNNKTNSSFKGNFVYIEVIPEASIRLQDLSLANSVLAGTDLRHIEFRHVDWRLDRWGRQINYDEFLLRKKELSSKRLSRFYGLVTFAGEIGPSINVFLNDALTLPDPPDSSNYGEIERLYRNIKMSYISAGDNKNAGDFHYGEMEMHRRASRWRWIPVYWYNLYRFLSGYGERPSWAISWLLFLLFSLAGLVYYLGLGFSHDGMTLANLGEYTGYWESFSYLLEKATLQRPTWAIPITTWGKVLTGISVLVLPGQTALFLMALRNRIGRRR